MKKIILLVFVVIIALGSFGNKTNAYDGTHPNDINHRQDDTAIDNANLRDWERETMEQRANRMPILGEKNYDIILRKNIVKDVIDTDYDSTEKSLKALFQRKDGNRSFISALNTVIGVLAVLYIIVIGIKFLFSDGDPEVRKKSQMHFAYVIVGLMVVSLAEFTAFKLLDPVTEAGDPRLLGSYTADSLETKIFQIISYVEIMITGVILIMLTLSGYALITGTDDTLEKEKKFVKSFGLGVILILLAESITRIFSEKTPEDKIFHGINEVVGLLNYALTFLGVSAFIMLIFASFYYVSNLGNDDIVKRAKQMMLGSVLGIIVCISSYTIATFMIR